MSATTVGLGLAAGMLTTLSPCVLPALPLVVGSAAAGHRHGPIALAAGLVSTFTIVGVSVAAAGPAIGLTDDAVRTVAALLLIVSGILLLVPRLQLRLSHFASPLASAAAQTAQRTGAGLRGQFVLGALLGAIWSPCVGPTLGSAIGLASSGGSLLSATTTMGAFGVGSAIPLLAMAYVARGARMTRGLLVPVVTRARWLFGGALVLIGVLVLTGADRSIEARILDVLPTWWINLLASV
jgi:cytochrome c-type biogenesis protein